MNKTHVIYLPTPPPATCDPTASLVSLLGNYDWKLRVAAAEALAALPATHGANTAAAILPLRNHFAWEVRHAALRALRHFAARNLAPHAPVLLRSWFFSIHMRTSVQLHRGFYPLSTLHRVP